LKIVDYISSMKTSIKFSDNKGIIKFLKDLKPDSEEIMAEEIESGLEEIRNDYLRLLPTDLAGGAGLRSGAYTDFNRSELKGEAGNTKEYAPFVEFGTGEKVDVPQGLEDYAMTFFVNGKGRLPANAALFPAFFRQVPIIIENIRKQLGQ